jgi:hypothetical protein
VSLKDGLRGNRVYIVVAAFVIIVIVLAVLFSGTEIYPAYVPDDVREGWSEDVAERMIDSKLFGLESWRSFTYRNNDTSYSAYLTVTTMKTFFMMNENELKEKTKQTIIEKASEQNIKIDEETEISGERTLKNGHDTMYVMYNGTNNITHESLGNIYEQVKFIGETWNCDKSSTSIICIGYAQVTDNAHNSSELNLKYWNKIISDKDSTFTKNPAGLIFNVKCH